MSTNYNLNVKASTPGGSIGIEVERDLQGNTDFNVKGCVGPSFENRVGVTSATGEAQVCITGGTSGFSATAGMNVGLSGGGYSIGSGYSVDLLTGEVTSSFETGVGGDVGVKFGGWGISGSGGFGGESVLNPGGYDFGLFENSSPSSPSGSGYDLGIGSDSFGNLPGGSSGGGTDFGDYDLGLDYDFGGGDFGSGSSDVGSSEGGFDSGSCGGGYDGGGYDGGGYDGGGYDGGGCDGGGGSLIH